MVRLTADLINGSLSYLNPLKERELDLRGHKIPAIENLGVASPQDALDLTDNDIATLSNFPLSPRLHSLYCARNRISSIHPTLPKSIPNLTTLALQQNQISELADLDVLSGFHRLIHFSVADNPVTAKENYRYWIIWRCPSIRFLDFQKVKDSERSKAKELFGTTDEPTELAQKIIAVRSNKATSFAPSAPSTNGTGKQYRVQLTPQERKKVEQLIRNAKSLQEITRLEKELNEGRIPTGEVDGMDFS